MRVFKRVLLAALSACALFAIVALSACGASAAKDVIRIGTMPTEDILPLWVAEQENLFSDAGLDVEIVVFDSASSLSAALTAGEVDMAMTDPMRAAKLAESGTDLSMEWVTLGAEPAQGRFGILVAPDSGFASLSDLKQGSKGVGVASNTVPEYVFDKLCAQEGIDSSSIVTSEVASLPDRFSLVSAGQLDAAALPASLLDLGEAQGMVVLADDTQGQNLSQSVMVARASFVEGDGASELVKIAEIWDEAAQQINADPESYRELLIEKANLNEKVASTYPISQYPSALTADGALAHPAAELIEPVLAWMAQKGYLEGALVYNEDDGTIVSS